MLDVELIDTPELGDRSYLVHDGRTAVAIDPQRDVDRAERLLDVFGLRLAAVAETHIHNDYVTGGLELARRRGADYLVHGDDAVSFSRRPVRDGQTLTYDGLEVRVLATPGHTDHHVSYLVEDGSGVPVLFSGGSLLFGSVGRTDLLGTELTEPLARAQYRSIQRLASELPGETLLYPTHGFGSFCSVAGGASATVTTTLAEERRSNRGLTTTDEDCFVAWLTAGLAAYPGYYRHMGDLNRRGPGPVSTRSGVLGGEAVVLQQSDGGWVVDARPRSAHHQRHLTGSLGIELGNQFSTYVGWLVPWGAPLTVVADSTSDLDRAHRQLSRIGIDSATSALATSALTAAGDDLTCSTRTATFDELNRLAEQPTVLDVRDGLEHRTEHLRGALHVPMGSLAAATLPDDELWIHCLSGFRASVAASFLQRSGHRVVVIDDDFERARSLGLTRTSERN